MRFTYISAANTGTNGVALGASGQDVLIKKILVGTPVAASTIIVYDKVNPFSGDTGNIAFKHTQPTAAAGNNLAYAIDFTMGEPAGGLQVDGGNVMCSGSSADITVLWEPLSEAMEG